MTFQRASGEGERQAPRPFPGTGTHTATPSTGSANEGEPASQTTVARVAALAATPSRSGTIERLVYSTPSEVWPEGSAPLLRWLRANPDVISDLLGEQLTDVAEEVPGSDACLFSDTSGHRLLVVVEMTESSESMFGTLMTRLTATHAQAALWICANARPEHTAAVSWLNRSVDARFYIARLRAARIGSSAAAPLLELTLRAGRAGDAASSNGPSGTPERGRRAEDWPDISLTERG